VELQLVQYYLNCLSIAYLTALDCFLNTSGNQFGFKYGLGCSFVIRVALNITDSFIKSGCTVNLCALGLSKASDKVNHHALFLKLMKWLIPYQLLYLLVFWFSCCYTCVKWTDTWSQFVLTFILELGKVLSYLLFYLHYSWMI